MIMIIWSLQGQIFRLFKNVEKNQLMKSQWRISSLDQLDWPPELVPPLIELVYFFYSDVVLLRALCEAFVFLPGRFFCGQGTTGFVLYEFQRSNFPFGVRGRLSTI